MSGLWAQATQVVTTLGSFPREFFFVALIESGLIAATTVLLAQPEAVFDGQSERFRGVARAGGWVLLCLLFCWSVVLGGVVVLSGLKAGA